MKQTRDWVISFCVALLASVVACAATEHRVQSQGGVGDVAALVSALNAAATAGGSDHTILLEPGVYDLSGVNMAPGSHLKISGISNSKIVGLGANRGDTILVGGGATDQRRVLHIAGSNITVTNLTVTGGYASTANDTDFSTAALKGCGGGCIANDDTATYADCIFSNNYASATATTSATVASGGGGVYRGAAKGCLFHGNSTPGSGGAISYSRTISGCIFTCNQSTASTYKESSGFGSGGGAVFLRTGNWNYITDSSFFCNTNSASGAIGGAVNAKGLGILTRCTFEGNYAISRGGAAFGALKAQDCSFTGNRADQGGAVGTPYSDSDDLLSGCGFTNNLASSGGAVWGHLYDVTNCIFSGNTASVSGGGAYVSKINRSISDCRFTGNTATSYGGGVYSEVSLTVRGCIFNGNRANTRGGGVSGYSASKRVKADGCAFTSNTSASDGGAAAYWADLSGCAITNHIASGSVVKNSNMSRCLVRGNSSTAWDKSLDNGGASFTNVNCLIVGNTIGGGNHVVSGKVNVNCTIVGNNMGNANYDSVLFNCKSYNCIIAGNKLNGAGCDIRTQDYGGPGTLSKCIYSVLSDKSGYSTSASTLADSLQVAYASIKFEDAANGDYTPRYSSPACNAGLGSDWLVSCVGATDFAGNQRVFDGAIDVGALECQKRNPGFRLICR